MHHRPNAAPNAAGVSPRAKTASKAETCLNRTDFGFRRCLAPDKLPDTKDRRGDSKPGDCRHVQNLLAVEAKGVHGVVHQGSESILDERLGNQHGGRCSSNDGRCLSMISKFPTIGPLSQAAGIVRLIARRLAILRARRTLQLQVIWPEPEPCPFFTSLPHQAGALPPSSVCRDAAVAA